ncbi:unnamed protein product, partial [marine sediment metagenome]
VQVIGRHFHNKDPELNANQLEDIADDIFDTLSNTPIGEAFPSKFTPKRFQPKPGFLKGRGLDIDDIELEQFLIDDIRIVAKRYASNVTPHVLMREIYGKNNIEVHNGVPMPKDYLEEIRGDFRRAKNIEQKAGNTAKAQKIKKKLDTLLNDLSYMMGELLNMNTPSSNGLRGLATDFARSEPVKKITQPVKGYTASAALGNMILAAFADISNPVLTSGLYRVIKVIPAVVLPKKFGGLAKRYFRAANIGIDRMDASRMAAIADIDEWG